MAANSKLAENDEGVMISAYRWWQDIEMGLNAEVEFKILRNRARRVFELQMALYALNDGKRAGIMARDVVTWPESSQKTLSHTILRMVMQIDRLVDDLAIEAATANGYRTLEG